MPDPKLNPPVAGAEPSDRPNPPTAAVEAAAVEAAAAGAALLFSSSSSASCALEYPAFALAKNAAENPPVAAGMGFSFFASASVSFFSSASGFFSSFSAAAGAGAPKLNPPVGFAAPNDAVELAPKLGPAPNAGAAPKEVGALPTELKEVGAPPTAADAPKSPPAGLGGDAAALGCDVVDTPTAAGFAAGLGGDGAGAANEGTVVAFPANAPSSSDIFPFFTVLVILGPEMRESTARTTPLVSAGSASEGAASRLDPAGDAGLLGAPRASSSSESARPTVAAGV